MSFLEGFFFFFFFLKQEVGKHSQPWKAQFSLKLYHPPFGMSPVALSKGLAILTPHLRVRDSLTSHPKENSEEEHAQPREEKTKLLV